MKMKSFARFLGTVLLVLSLLLVVSCKSKERPAEINEEQSAIVIGIGTDIVNNIFAKGTTARIDAQGAATIEGNLKVENGNQEYFELKDVSISGCVAEYTKVKEEKTSTEPGIGVSTASATIIGRKADDKTKTVEIPVAVSVGPEETAGGTITKGTIKIGGTTFKVEDDPEDEEILAALSSMDLTNIIVEKEDHGEVSNDLNTDLIKKYADCTLTAEIKDVGIVINGTNKDGVAFKTALTLDGKIDARIDAPGKNGKARYAKVDSNFDFTIEIAFGENSSKFVMNFKEKNSTDSLEAMIAEIEKAFDSDLDLDGLKSLMVYIGLTATPKYASVNGVEVDAASYLNFLIAFAAEQANSKNEKEPEPQPQS